MPLEGCRDRRSWFQLRDVSFVLLAVLNRLVSHKSLKNLALSDLKGILWFGTRAGHSPRAGRRRTGNGLLSGSFARRSREAAAPAPDSRHPPPAARRPWCSGANNGAACPTPGRSAQVPRRRRPCRDGSATRWVAGPGRHGDGTVMELTTSTLPSGSINVPPLLRQPATVPWLLLSASICAPCRK